MPKHSAFLLALPRVTASKLAYTPAPHAGGRDFQLTINYPAASSGVLEQRQLVIFMQFVIFHSLIFHILSDDHQLSLF